jgi:Ca2+-binding EF-hand superfamily protein
MFLKGNYNTGLLDAKELEHILMTKGERLKNTDLDEVFKLIDLKSNNTVDYEEKV